MVDVSIAGKDGIFKVGILSDQLHVPVEHQEGVLTTMVVLVVTRRAMMVLTRNDRDGNGNRD